MYRNLNETNVTTGSVGKLSFVTVIIHNMIHTNKTNQH